MIVITRNGKTTVYRGWQAWGIALLAMVMLWVALAFVAVVLVGAALTASLVLLLFIPAAIIVELVVALTRR